MTSENFCYWLQGLFEIANPERLTTEQTRLIREHLSLAFRHDIDRRYPADQQQALSDIHRGNASSEITKLKPMC